VVFEPAIGDVGLTWGLVQPAVSEHTSTFTHDRPGLGGSEPSDSPRTVDVMVDELRAALHAARFEPPYLLVGHSFASLTVQAFTHRHRAEVSGLVLVDGAHEDQMERFPEELNPKAMMAGVADQLRGLANSARQGEALPELMPVPGSFPETLAAAYRDATSPTPDHLEAVAAEYDGLEPSQIQVRALSKSSFDDLPFIAIRHGVPQLMPGVSDEINDRYEHTWQELQEDLAGRSSSGRVVVAVGAGHLIHHDRPDVVVDAILELMR